MRAAESGTGPALDPAAEDPAAEDPAAEGRGAADRGALCPSSTCHEGAVLIGVLGPDGRLGYVRPPLPVDEHFLAASAGTGDPESRFRFADTCAQDACEHWSDRHCTLIGRLIRARPEGEPEAAGTLPRCGIRAACRWFAQDGERACGICPLVVHRPAPAGAHHATTTTRAAGAVRPDQEESRP